uniref:Uncharacterized protein n=1 Tax=Rhipicephalus zambeziensis TaxID=60191 RepID=A0A224YGG2_9ACAR
MRTKWFSDKKILIVFLFRSACMLTHYVVYVCVIRSNILSLGVKVTCQHCRSCGFDSGPYTKQCNSIEQCNILFYSARGEACWTLCAVGSKQIMRAINACCTVAEVLLKC